MCVKTETATTPEQAIKVFRLNQGEPLIAPEKPSPKAIALGVEDAYFKSRFRNREVKSGRPD